MSSEMELLKYEIERLNERLKEAREEASHWKKSHKALMKKNEELEEFKRMHDQSSLELLKLSKNKLNWINDIWHYHEPLDVFNPDRFKDGKYLPSGRSITDYIFITITFDPKLFGTELNDELRRNYILYYSRVLLDCTFYGSFERHKSGIIHAHIISHISDNDKEKTQELRDRFTQYFARYKVNKTAIQIGPMNIKKAEAYINKKESKDNIDLPFFLYHPNNSYVADYAYNID